MLHDVSSTPSCGFTALSRDHGGDSHATVTHHCSIRARANPPPCASVSRDSFVNADDVSGKHLSINDNSAVAASCREQLAQETTHTDPGAASPEGGQPRAIGHRRQLPTEQRPTAAAHSAAAAPHAEPARPLAPLTREIAGIVRAQRLRDMMQSIADWQRASGHDRHRARLAARHDIRAFRTHLALDRRNAA